MLLFLVLFLIFAIVTAACWFQGFWSNMINVVNMTFAGLIATNYYEPVSEMMESIDRGLVYVYDIFAFWLLFMFAYGMLRLHTDSFSKTKLEFAFPVEMAGRSIMAAWCGWLFVCLSAFSIQFAPVAAAPLGAWDTPQSKAFLFVHPDRLWLSFVKRCSRGSLSRGVFKPELIDPRDAASKAQVFDSKNEFLTRHYHRRKNLEGNDGLKVSR